MSYKGKPIIVTINGIDLSQHIQSIGDWAPTGYDELLHGIQTVAAPIEISGRFDDGTLECIVCRGSFVPGPEGIATLTVESTGEQFTPVCHACGTSLLAPSL
jgi:hypothetical protein